MSTVERPRSSFNHVFDHARDQNVSDESRRHALNELLITPGGPFLDSHAPLYKSIQSLAETLVAAARFRRGLPPGVIDARDVAHDAIITFCTHGHAIRKAHALRGWLWPVMSRSISRYAAHLPAVDDIDDLTPTEAAQLQDRHPYYSPAPHVPAKRDEDVADDGKAEDDLLASMSEEVRAALDSLSPGLRDVAILHGGHGMPFDAVAQELEVAAGAVRVRWHRAKQILEKKLAHLRRR